MIIIFIFLFFFFTSTTIQYLYYVFIQFSFLIVVSCRFNDISLNYNKLHPIFVLLFFSSVKWNFYSSFFSHKIPTFETDSFECNQFCCTLTNKFYRFFFFLFLFTFDLYVIFTFFRKIRYFEYDD